MDVYLEKYIISQTLKNSFFEENYVAPYRKDTEPYRLVKKKNFETTLNSE